MADNVVANSGTGGATFAADDIGGVHFPRTKLIHGADGVNAGDVSTANPLPTVQTAPANLLTGSAGPITTTTSTSVIAAQGAGVRAYITALTVSNSHATVGTLVTITDGSAGAILWHRYVAAVGGGVSLGFPTPLRTTANTALHAVCGTSGASVYVSASGYAGA
jgi:hypothetical protein